MFRTPARAGVNSQDASGSFIENYHKLFASVPQWYENRVERSARRPFCTVVSFLIDFWGGELT
jgi:hypothetical protein